MEWRPPVGVLVVMGAGRGATIPLTKIAVAAGYRQFGLIFRQLVFPPIILAKISIYKELPPKLLASHWMLVAVIAIPGALMPRAFSLIAHHPPAGVLAITISLVAIFSLAIAVMLPARPVFRDAGAGRVPRPVRRPRAGAAGAAGKSQGRRNCLSLRGTCDKVGTREELPCYKA